MGEHKERRLSLSGQPMVWENETGQVHGEVCSSKGREPARVRQAVRFGLSVAARSCGDLSPKDVIARGFPKSSSLMPKAFKARDGGTQRVAKVARLHRKNPSTLTQVFRGAGRHLFWYAKSLYAAVPSRTRGSPHRRLRKTVPPARRSSSSRSKFARICIALPKDSEVCHNLRHCSRQREFSSRDFR